MYIKVDENKITNEQLKAISEILGSPRLDVVRNVHYEACKHEIECAIENTMEMKELAKYKEDGDYEFMLEDLTGQLYYSSDRQWDDLYEKAEAITYRHLSAHGLIEEDDI